MTRKKYDRDYEGEAIREIYGKDESESDEEEEEVEEYDPWDEVQHYIDYEIPRTSADWITKWFDATDLINIVEAKYDDPDAFYYIKEYLFPYEMTEDVYCLFDHIWNIHDICRIEPNLNMLYNATLELLAERTKYYYVNDTVPHRTLTTKKFFRQMGKRSDTLCTNSQL